MDGNASSTIRFFLERWIQKGVLHQLLLMAALVALVATAGGLVAHALTPAFGSASEAIWWAFLRLTDPGYLGDDEGAILRTVSTVVTVLGYVIFMGSLIAIMTQWLSQTLRKLEAGLTPITMKDHVVILGWTNRTPEIVLKLLGARGRLQRFLERRDASKLRVVVLSDDVGAERRVELREYLGALWNDSQLFLRSGSSLQPDHLERLDLRRASAVVIPGADFELGGAEATDTRVVKTLLTVDGYLKAGGDSARPHVVAEIFDPLKVPLARSAVEGDVEVISSDRLISRLISQSVRHRGIARVLLGILSHREGNSIYVRGFPGFEGLSPYALHDAFPRAVILGFVRGEDGVRTAGFDPDTDAVLRPGDSLVLLAQSFDGCVPTSERAQPTARTHRVEDEPPSGAPEVHRVLALGWSHKIGALAVELDESGRNPFELTVVSRVSVGEREAWLARVTHSDDVQVRHVVADYALESDLTKLDLGSYDNVVFLASDWMSSSQEADARTILGYTLLRSVLKGVPEPPEILIELLDPDNARLFGDNPDLCLVSPRVLSYLLAHVALHPVLNSVFDALFCAGGNEFGLRSARKLGLSGKAAAFPEIQRTALEHGVIALGVLTASGELGLNPDRSRSWTLDDADHIVVLA